MDFGANKTPIEGIKEGAFGGTYFRNIYSGVNVRQYRKSWKELNELKNVDINCLDYYDLGVDKYGVRCRISLRF